MVNLNWFLELEIVWICKVEHTYIRKSILDICVI